MNADCNSFVTGHTTGASTAIFRLESNRGLGKKIYGYAAIYRA
jgi:hypothetical protein